MNQITIKPKIKFINEWTSGQFEDIEDAITHHFLNKELHTIHGTYTPTKRFKKIDEILGLAYTSSGSYAGYWICNTELYHDAEYKWHYNAFAIGKDGKFYATIQNSEESEFIIEL